MLSALMPEGRLPFLITSPRETERYNPAPCIDGDRKVLNGSPETKHVSTSYIQRQKLMMRITRRPSSEIAALVA